MIHRISPLLPFLLLSFIPAHEATLVSHLTLSGKRASFTAPHGYPWLHMSGSEVLPLTIQGAPSFVHALAMGQVEPLSLVINDFDEDGLPDAVSGFGLGEEGFLVIETNLPELAETGRPRQSHRQTLFETGLRPDFLTAGDFDADGHADIVVASRDASFLMMLAGTGAGGFERPRTVQLPGIVHALAAGDINRRDDTSDLAVGVQLTKHRLSSSWPAPLTDEPAAVLVYEHPAGAFSAPPEVLPAPSAPHTLVIERLDEDEFYDLASAGDNRLDVIYGRDRYFDSQLDEPARLRLTVPQGIRTMTAGTFRRDILRELALVTDAGDVVLFDGVERTIETTPIHLPGLDSAAPLHANHARISTLPREELLVLDAASRRLHIVHAPAFSGLGYPAAYPEQTPMPQTASAQTYIDLASAPAAIMPHHINRDGLQDLAILGSMPRPGSGQWPALSVATSQFVSTFTVNEDGFESDADQGDGVCATLLTGNCTYNAAWQEANASPGQDLITFAIPKIEARATAFLDETATIDGSAQGRVEVYGAEIRDNGGNSLITNMALRNGIAIRDVSGGSRIENNFIGTTVEGTTIAEDTPLGILLLSPRNTIGGNSASAGNLISNISFSSNAAGNVVQGNYIGINADGSAALQTASVDINKVKNGVSISSRDNIDNLVGGTTQGEENVIGGFEEWGIDISFAGAGNRIIGNIVGLNAAGDAAIPNVEGGIYEGSSGANLIGSSASRGGNVVSGNSGIGIHLFSSEESVISGNIVGLDPEGFSAFPNAGHGIYLQQLYNVMIGTGLAQGGNTIANSGQDGILLFSADSIEIYGNRIGTTLDGIQPAGNDSAGIRLTRGEVLTIGGTRLEQANVIAGNGSHGISLEGFEAGYVIQGNAIGADLSASSAMGNGGHGIFVDDDAELIGGRDPDASNLIANNSGDGIRFNKPGNLLGNAIYDNGGLGIDYKVSDNLEDQNGVNQGPVGDIANPSLTALSATSVQATLTQSSANRNKPYLIEFFGNDACDPSGYGEGRLLLNTDSLTTDDAGVGELTASFSVREDFRFITARATNEEDGSSEFSNCVEIEGSPLTRVQVFTDSLQNAPVPVANLELLVGTFEDGNLDPISRLEIYTTDANGMLELDPALFPPGASIYIKTREETVPAVKLFHEAVDDVMYNKYIDNLVQDRDGNIRSARISDTPGEATETYLGHSVVGWNLVVGIEWRAEPEYIENLRAMFLVASNFLFDVTDGHAFFNRIAIYDNKQVWRHADIQMYARNTMWPQAPVDAVNFKPITQEGDLENNGEKQMMMPPVHFGGLKAQESGPIDDPGSIINVNQSFVVPLDPFIEPMLKTVVHEFGHYALGFYDEYRGIKSSADGAEFYGSVGLFENFGFMDNASQQPMGSEMSERVSSSYMETENFQRRSGSSWDLFRARFEGEHRGLPFLIHPPSDRGWINTGYVRGPNDDLGSPDYNIGLNAYVSATIETSGASVPREAFDIFVEENGQLEPAVGANVRTIWGRNTGSALAGRVMKQGQPVLFGEDKGKIRIFDFEATEPITLIAERLGGRNRTYQAVRIEADALSKTLANTLVLSEPAGNPTFLVGASFDASGNMTSTIEASSLALDPTPTVTILESDEEPLPLSEAGGIYKAVLPVLPASGNTLLLDVPDADGVFFPVSSEVSMLFPEEDVLFYASSANVEVYLAPASAADIEKLSILSTTFPVPRAGLNENLILAAPVHALGYYPASAALDGTLTIQYAADSLFASVEEAVGIYRWDGAQWQSLETGVEIEEQTASAALAGEGLYGVFLDRTQTTQVSVDPHPQNPLPDRLQLLSNYPNPFTEQTTISFALPTPRRVRLVVYDALGRQIARLTDRVYDSGLHTVVFDGTDLAPGTYFYELQTNSQRKTGKMVRVK